MDITTICSSLNTYLFQNVWNEPYKNYRRSIKLNKMFTNSRTGYFETPSHSIVLPTTLEPYYIYYIDKRKLDYKDFEIEDGTWKSISEINNSKFFLTFVNSGKILHRGSIFFYRYEPSDDIFVCISKKMMAKVSGAIHNSTLTDLIVYYDWDYVDDVVFDSITIKTQADRLTAWNLISSANTNIIHNGQKKLNIAYSELLIGDYVEVINDPNVKIEFTLDLTDDAQKRTFTSLEDSKVYTICHIPKILNNLNKLYTHNVIDIYVSAKHPEPESVSGLLLHSNTLLHKQVTHNDFGIREDLLTSYVSLVGSEELVLTVQVKENSKLNRLSRDKNYIDLLYRHTDEEILQFLEGSGNIIFNFWRADVLSASNYVKYMMVTPTYVNSSNINTFIDTFGYQYVLSLITDNIRKFTFTENIQYPFVVKKPEVYFNDTVNVSLFVRGLKIPNDQLSIDIIDDVFLSVSVLDEDFEINDGDECIIEMFDLPHFSNILFSPSNISNSITLTSSDYKVYRMNNVSTTVKGVDSTYTKYFYESATSSYVVATVAGGYKYTFIPSTYGNNYIFVPVNGNYIYSKNLDSDITAKGPIFIELTQPVLNSVLTIPCLSINTSKVYLNGRSLVEGIDYKFIKYKSNSQICGTQVVVYNRSYVRSTGNILEVVLSKNESDKNQTFFNSTQENMITSSFTWFDSIGTVTIDGLQVISAYNTNSGILIDETHRAGALVESTCIYPKQTKTFIDQFRSTEADQRHEIVVSYFKSKIPPFTGVITIPYPHDLYSIKTTVILRDLILGSLVFTLDPAGDKMIELLSEYNYLDDVDIINDNIDKRFIDFYPCHSDITVVNATVYRLVDYVSKLLITDPLTYGGVS